MDHSTALVPMQPAPLEELKPAPGKRPKRVRAKVVQLDNSIHRIPVPIEPAKETAAVHIG
jgi:hypothetical protein